LKFEYHSAGNVAKTMQLILAWMWLVNHNKKYFSYTQGNLLLHWYNTEDGGWNQNVLWDKATTYYHATIYHRHL